MSNLVNVMASILLILGAFALGTAWQGSQCKCPLRPSCPCEPKKLPTKPKGDVGKEVSFIHPREDLP